MKVGVYEIINDPLPQLSQIREIDAKPSEFKSDKGMVTLLNRELNMDKLHAEHMYVIAHTSVLVPKGILLAAVGSGRKAEFDTRTVGTGLLLLGAERFTVFHNHPNKVKKLSKGDMVVTFKAQHMAAILGLNFDDHIMITEGFYDYCDKDINDY